MDRFEFRCAFDRMPATRCIRRVVQLTMIILVLCTLAACSASGGYELPDAPEGRAPILYRVRPGDTLWGISQRYRIESARLALWNRLENPNALEVGQQLVVGFQGLGSRETVKSSSETKREKPVRARELPIETVQVTSRTPQNRNGGDLAWPLHTGRVLSGFGPRTGSFHDGIDIAAPEGTPIYAAHSGTVIYADNDLGGYGNLAIVRHRTGLVSVYAHNSRLHVREGDQIARGALVGEVGSTGHATGPHLHFEVRVRDRQQHYVAVDPLPLLTDASTARPRYRVNEGLRSILSRILPGSSDS